MLAGSEKSGISEPQLGPGTSGVGSAGTEFGKESAVQQDASKDSHNPTHQSVLDVSQLILQHRDLAGLFRDLAPLQPDRTGNRQDLETRRHRKNKLIEIVWRE